MRLPLLCRIDRYTTASVVLLPAEDREGIEPVQVPTRLTAITLLGSQYFDHCSGPYELTDMDELQRAEAACLRSVIAWVPGWKLRELGLKSMMPEDKQNDIVE